MRVGLATQPTPAPPGRPSTSRAAGPPLGFGEAVISPARSQRILLPGRAAGIELEHGARVVVETADQIRVELVLDGCGIEQPAHRGPVLRAFVAEVVDDLRRTVLEGLLLWHFGVEEPQRIALQAQLRVAPQLRFERPVDFLQALQVWRAGVTVAAGGVLPADGPLPHCTRPARP